MDLRETVERFYRSYSQHDLEGVLALLSEDVVILFPTSSQPIRGRHRIRSVWSMVFSTVIPDVQQHELTTVVQGDLAACTFVETGTVVIPPDATSSLGIPAGGRSYRIDMAAFFHADGDGLIDRIRSYWDTGSYADQLGIDVSVIRTLQTRAQTA